MLNEEFSIKLNFQLARLPDLNPRHLLFTVNSHSGYLIYHHDRSPMRLILFVHDCREEIESGLDLLGDLLSEFAFAGIDVYGSEMTFGFDQSKLLSESLRFLLSKFSIEHVIFWGRGSGTFAILKLLHSDPRLPLSGLVLDCPSVSAKNYQRRSQRNQTRCFLAKWLDSCRCGLDKSQYFQVQYLSMLKNVKVPLFLLGQESNPLFPYQDVIGFYETYQGKKEILNCQGAARPSSALIKVLNFLMDGLDVDRSAFLSRIRQETKSTQDFRVGKL